MRAIPATRGYVALVDDEDFYWLSEYKWRAVATDKKDGRWTCFRPVRAISAAEGGGSMLMYRQIMNPPPGMVVDHIDGDPWNNQRSNLRVCTQAQNLQNQRKPRHGRTPFKGVTPARDKFVAGICANGVSHHIGTFDDAKTAALAYDAAALALCGEFARLNFPDAGTEPRHPSEIREALKAAAPYSIMRRRAVARMLAGETASAVARSMGLAKQSVCRWASDEGIKLRRGPIGGISSLAAAHLPAAPKAATALIAPRESVAAGGLA